MEKVMVRALERWGSLQVPWIGLGNTKVPVYPQTRKPKPSRQTPSHLRFCIWFRITCLVKVCEILDVEVSQKETEAHRGVCFACQKWLSTPAASVEEFWRCGKQEGSGATKADVAAQPSPALERGFRENCWETQARLRFFSPSTDKSLLLQLARGVGVL